MSKIVSYDLRSSDCPPQAILNFHIWIVGYETKSCPEERLQTEFASLEFEPFNLRHRNPGNRGLDATIRVSIKISATPLVASHLRYVFSRILRHRSIQSGVWIFFVFFIPIHKAAFLIVLQGYRMVEGAGVNG